MTLPNTSRAIDGASLVSQTIADGTVTNPGQNLTQSWTLRNTGTTTWTTGTSGYTLNFVSGDRMGAASTGLLLASPVAPNGQATFSVQLTAPTAPGTYTGLWRMNSAAAIDFGPTVSVKIVVTGAIGQTVNGALTDTDADSFGRSSGKADYYTLTGSGTVTITLRSTAFDAYLFLYDQTKRQVAYDDDSAGNQNSQITYTLVAGQTYYVEATSYNATGRGAYVLTVSAGTLVAIGSPWPSRRPNLTPYTPNGWSDKIVVTRRIGSTTDDTDLSSADTLYVDWAVINSGDGATSARFYTELYVDGTLIETWYSNPPVNPNGWVSVTDYSIGNLSPGQHTIRIKADSRGDIAESNENDNEYIKTITIGVGQTVNGALTDTDADSFGRSSGKADYYTLTGSGTVTITLRSTAFDAYLFLYDQTKRQVAYDDDSAGNQNSRITYTLVAGQTYYVEATSYNATGRGAYVLTASSGALTALTTAPIAKAVLDGPTPGSTLTSSSATFSWSAGSGVLEYWLTVGTTSGGYNIYGQSQGVNRSVTVPNLPVDGSTIYVRLHSRFSGGWQYNDYTYTEAMLGQTINGTLVDTDAESHGRTGTKADYYTLIGSGSVTITLKSTAFDAYLFLYDQTKTRVAYDDDSAGNQNSRITYALVAGQTYYVEATSYSTGGRGSYALIASTGTLTAVANPWPPTPPIEVQNSIPFGALAGGQDSQVFYKINVPSGQSRLEIRIYGGTGDCDLYVRRGSPPTIYNWDYRPYLSGNNETVTVGNPTSGYWYIMLSAYRSYSGVSLLARYGPTGTTVGLITATTRLLGQDLFQKYAGGKKYLFFGAGDFSAGSLVSFGTVKLGPSLGGALYIDIDDYLGITPEGWNRNWVTLWLRASGCVFGAGLAASAGIQERDFNPTDNPPDREFPGESTAVNAVIGGLSLSGATLSTDGTFEGWSLDPLNFGFNVCVGGWLSPSTSVEVQRDALDAALANAFTAGLTPALIGPALMSHLFNANQTTINKDDPSVSNISWRLPIRIPSDKTDDTP